MSDFGAQCDCNRWQERLLRHGCLHDCCYRCHGGTHIVHSADNSEKAKLVCTTCDNARELATENTSYPTYLPEMPLSVNSGTASASSVGLMCECCQDEPPSARREAEYFCESCSATLLCFKCKQLHDRLCGDKHSVMWLGGNNAAVLYERWGALKPTVLCGLHRFTCDRWCSTCGTAGCHACAKQCIEKHHTVLFGDELDLQSPSSRLLTSSMELESKLTSLRRIELVYEQEHKADMQELKRRKTNILNALDSAFDAAHQVLESSIRDSRQTITNLRYAIESEIRCSRVLTGHPLPSHLTLMKGAHEAVDRLLHKTNRLAVREEEILARLGSTSPKGNLDDIMRSWIGWPAPHDIPTTSLTLLNDNFASKGASTYYNDIAITHCEHVLVAAGKNGLLELDSDGMPVDQWLPPSVSVTTATFDQPNENDDLVAVDCLDDDRSVVGLKNSHAVVLLERIDAGGILHWKEQKRFDLETAAPFAVAARKELVVVAMGSVDAVSRLLRPGSEVAAFDLNSGDRSAFANFNFEIDSIALAAENSVIVSSHFRVDVFEACKGQFVLECRTSDLQNCMWRVSRDHEILDIATSASGALVYANISRVRGRQLIALEARSGLLSRNASSCRSRAAQNGGIRGMPDVSPASDGKCRRGHEPNGGDAASRCHDVQSQFACHDTKNHHDLHTENNFFRKLSCSKSKGSHLAALRLDSRAIVHMPADVNENLLLYSQQRRLYLIKELFNCLARATSAILLFSVLVVSVISFAMVFLLLFKEVAEIEINLDKMKKLEKLIILFIIFLVLCEVSSRLTSSSLADLMSKNRKLIGTFFDKTCLQSTSSTALEFGLTSSIRFINWIISYTG